MKSLLNMCTLKVSKLHRIRLVGVVCIALLFASLSILYVRSTDARYLNTFRDTLSDSAPNEYSNHTIEFQVNTPIPPSGYIRIRPGDGAFSIPTSTFDIDQTELYVAPPSQGYSLRSASTTVGPTNDGVSITYGVSGDILFTLNSTTGITAGSNVRIRLGNHTTNSTTTDTGIVNPTATGTQPIYIEAGGLEEASARALVAIVNNITVGPVDTKELIPPVRFNGLPSGILSGLVTAAEISVETDEFAHCRYSSASGTPFYSMTNQFDNTGSVVHSFVARGLIAESTYHFYVRCLDDENNSNIDDYEITFTIEPAPEGEPGAGEDEGASGNNDGTGTGSGGTGSGTSGGDTSSSQSGSGGSRGGGGGGGGLDDTDRPYESGEGRVIVSGYGFPGSTVTFLVDGDIVDTMSVTNSGLFTTTIEEIANGVYTFGVYATDKNRVKSTTFTTTFTVSGARESTLSNIRLMPTIRVTPDPVDIGAQVTFEGYAIPNSTVTLETQQDKSKASLKTFTATAGSDGKWSTTVSTSGFARDTWKVRAKSAQVTGTIATEFSQYTFYGVGGKAVALTGNNSDLNRDGKVNLIDFSILLFHWNTNGGTSNPPADINRDGKVSLTDFSILIFNWTG